VGFQGAIVRVLLQCFRDPRRLIRAIICELSVAYFNPPRPRLLRTRAAPQLLRTRTVFFSGPGRRKLDIVFENAGEQQLKNIARPVRVYRIRTDSGVPAPPVIQRPLSAGNGPGNHQGTTRVKLMDPERLIA
jgi:hypothetical protein